MDSFDQKFIKTQGVMHVLGWLLALGLMLSATSLYLMWKGQNFSITRIQTSAIPCGIVIRKEYIPNYWFTHITADNNGVRSAKDFQPDQWYITVKLTSGSYDRFQTDQAGYDTLKLNQKWQSK